MKGIKKYYTGLIKDKDSVNIDYINCIEHYIYNYNIYIYILGG